MQFPYISPRNNTYESVYLALLLARSLGAAWTPKARENIAAVQAEFFEVFCCASLDEFANAQNEETREVLGYLDAVVNGARMSAHTLTGPRTGEANALGLRFLVLCGHDNATHFKQTWEGDVRAAWNARFPHVSLESGVEWALAMLTH